jgi:hypothetical protein
MRETREQAATRALVEGLNVIGRDQRSHANALFEIAEDQATETGQSAREVLRLRGDVANAMANLCELGVLVASHYLASVGTTTSDGRIARDPRPADPEAGPPRLHSSVCGCGRLGYPHLRATQHGCPSA